MLKFNEYKQCSSYIDILKQKELFDNYWENMKYNFRKLEALQFYNEQNNLGYSHFIQNNFYEFSNDLRQYRNDEERFYFDALNKKIKLDRLHLIEFPINKYIEFEYYTYYMSANLGEQIYFIDNSKIYNEELLDFILFDDKHLLINDYDKSGNLKGAWDLETNVSKITNEIIKWYDEKISIANSFENIIKPNSDIVEMILKDY